MRNFLSCDSAAITMLDNLGPGFSVGSQSPRGFQEPAGNFFDGGKIKLRGYQGVSWGFAGTSESAGGERI